GHAEFVERPLARGRIACAIPDVALLDLGVGDAGVLQCLGARLPRHVGVVPALSTWLMVRSASCASARLLELRHAHADDEYPLHRSIPSLRCASATVARPTRTPATSCGVPPGWVPAHRRAAGRRPWSRRGPGCRR